MTNSLTKFIMGVAMAMLVIVVATSSCAAIEKDKAAHAIIGSLIGYAGEEDGMLLATLAGVAKEACDADARDIVATAIGGALVQLLRYGHLRISGDSVRNLSWHINLVSPYEASGCLPSDYERFRVISDIEWARIAIGGASQ
jgi:hypothetical protein